MPQYRIKYSLYRIDAVSAEEAKKKIVGILKKNAEDFLAVEDASLYDDRRPLWRRFLG